MNSSVAIAVNDVSKVFGQDKNRVTALDRVSLDIQENEFFTLLGPSGCGKTTLLRLIAGFEHPSGGNILLHGQEISHLPPFKRPVNTVFQNYALFPHMSVAENIGFGLTMQDKPTAEVKSTVDNMLALVQMEDLADRRTDQISGGQQQRVALARALAPHPKVLLLDEPLSALDYKLRKEMQLELKRLQSETGITFIFVTHDQEEALTMSDRVAVMNHGRVLQVGAPTTIYDHPAERFVADFIGDTNFLSAEVLKTEGASVYLKLASGRQINIPSPETLPAALCGATPSAENTTGPIAGKVSIAVRPERASMNDDPAGSDLSGTIENIVYSGNDTHIHVQLASSQQGAEQLFVIRTQNRVAGTQPWHNGQQVGIVLEPGSVQVLRD